MKSKAFLILCCIISFANYAQTWNPLDYSIYPAAAGFTGTYPNQASSAGFPEFSWDKVPLWCAVRNSARFTDAQINTLANNYKLIMLEKSNQQGLANTNLGIIDASTRLKAVNPKIKTLFYWNTHLGYGGYSSDAVYKANEWEWTKHTTDANGNEILSLHKDYIYWYNQEVAAMRTWWINEALKMANNPVIDGVFLDKCFMGKEGHLTMIKELNNKMPAGKIIIGNTLRNELGNGSRAMMEFIDGSYLERWDMRNRSYTQTEADAICVSLQMMREALSKGEMIAMQSNPADEDDLPATLAEKRFSCKKTFIFRWPVFL